MTLSPSLKKVNDVLADDAILHHKWDKKANIIDDGNNNINSNYNCYTNINMNSIDKGDG